MYFSSFFKKDFDNVFLANIISTEIANLRQYHKNYLLFLEVLLKEALLMVHRDPLYMAVGKNFVDFSNVDKLLVILKGRLTPFTRPTTRTKTYKLFISSEKNLISRNIRNDLHEQLKFHNFIFLKNFLFSKNFYSNLFQKIKFLYSEIDQNDTYNVNHYEIKKLPLELHNQFSFNIKFKDKLPLKTKNFLFVEERFFLNNIKKPVDSFRTLSANRYGTISVEVIYSVPINKQN